MACMLYWVLAPSINLQSAWWFSPFHGSDSRHTMAQTGALHSPAPNHVCSAQQSELTAQRSYNRNSYKSFCNNL